MTIIEIRDRSHAVWKSYREPLDAFKAEVAKGLKHIINGKDETDAIVEERTQACAILWAIFEYFDRLAQAPK